MTAAIKSIPPVGIGLVLTGLTLGLGYGVQRSDFEAFLALYAAFFALYAWLVFGVGVSPQNPKTPKPQNTLYAWLGLGAGISSAHLRFYLALGVFLRVLLLFGLPNLSDDVFRFLWDGRLIANGIHPFAHPPVWFSDNSVWPTGLDAALFQRLNSPEYHTVYPPVCQGVFALAAWLSPHNWWGGVLCMKVFLLLCEIGSIWLLQRNGSSGERSAALLYALNPLLILEIVGNCHFEGAAIFFLLAARPGLSAKAAGPYWSAFFLALSVASKLVPLLFVPLFCRWLGWKKGARFLLVFVLATVLLFLPLLDIRLLLNMAQSLDLYFQKFAFNASIYYVLWEIGLYFRNYNMVNTLGPAVGGVQLLLMAVLFFRLKPASAPETLRLAMVGVLCVYLFGASTVHPWYVTLLLTVSIAPFGQKAIGYPYLFAVVWSGSVALSYSHYNHGGFVEHKGLIALEYGLLLVGWLREVQGCKVAGLQGCG